MRTTVIEDIRRARLIIKGRVQGGGYRYEARAFATSLGLSGWVRNRHDGTVEGVFEGPRERVELLLHWCRRGPSAAYVEGIEIEWQEPTFEQGFSIG